SDDIAASFFFVEIEDMLLSVERSRIQPNWCFHKRPHLILVIQRLHHPEWDHPAIVRPSGDRTKITSARLEVRSHDAEMNIVFEQKGGIFKFQVIVIIVRDIIIDIGIDKYFFDSGMLLEVSLRGPGQRPDFVKIVSCQDDMGRNPFSGQYVVERITHAPYPEICATR